jgi:hypothetical protein
VRVLLLNHYFGFELDSMAYFYPAHHSVSARATDKGA